MSGEYRELPKAADRLVLLNQAQIMLGIAELLNGWQGREWAAEFAGNLRKQADVTAAIANNGFPS